jgi:hypothetical protein
MQVHPMPNLAIASLAAWAFACAVAFFGQSDLSFSFAYFVLPFSAYLVPILVSLLAANFYGRSFHASCKVGSAKIQAMTSALLACISYIVCVVVLSRLLEIPWRQAKFGDPVLSLGLSSAGFYAFVVALFASLTVVVLRQVPKNSKTARVCVCSLAMLGFSSAAYLLVCLSPLVEWRS